MRALLRISALIDRMTEWIGRLNVLLVTALIAIGFLNVIGRYVGRFVGLRLTSNSVIELQWYLFSLVFLLGFPYILKHNLNVRVDFLSTNWSPQRRAWVDLIGHVIAFIPFCLIGIYAASGPVLRSWGMQFDGSFNISQWELSPDPEGLPRAPIKTMIIVSFVLLLLQTFSEIIKMVGVIRGAVALEAVQADASDSAQAEALVQEYRKSLKQE